MKDRYLFRGKRFDDGEWIIGGLVHTEDHWITGRNGELEYIKESTIGQCTGLKDKNGKLIFEGDVVNYQYASWDSEENNVTVEGQVIWTTAGFRVANAEGMCANVGDRPSTIEIIGNIHEA